MSDIKKNPSVHKHLTFEDHIVIQDCLYHGVSFKAIVLCIGNNPTTISKEVKNHLRVFMARAENPRPCPDLLKAPFVYNECMRKRNCKIEKRECLAKTAHHAYRDTLVECWTGIALSKELF